MNKKIKWGCIQPLTGGMYLGAEKAIGHPADWVISFDGLCDIKRREDGSIKEAANEYSLFNYLKEENRLPPYLSIKNRGMFDADKNLDIELGKNAFSTTDSIDWSDTDIVVAVPVCSGLSSATTCSQETRDKKNGNQKWITEFVLEKVQPKVFVYENAPGLFSNKGKPVRDYTKAVAEKNGYSVAYYLTDTMFHDNCQRRKRTFCFFFKNTDRRQCAPLLRWENVQVDFNTFIGRIPKGVTQNDIRPVGNGINNAIIEYYKSLPQDKFDAYTNEWPSTLCALAANNELDSWDEFCKKRGWDFSKYIQHVKDKMAVGSFVFDTSPKTIRNGLAPTVFHKNAYILNPITKEYLTVRELLTLMGMPYNFTFYGNDADYICKIGQNVPARTAQWIVSECVRIINEWDNPVVTSLTQSTETYFDNTKQRVN